VGVNRSFKPKHENLKIAKLNLIKQKFEDTATTINYTSWVAYHYPTANPTFADGHHLENDYDVITRPRMVRFRWNLVSDAESHTDND